MKYFISEEYGTAYFLENGQLAGCPLSKDGTFDADESFIVERPHDEVPEEYYAKVIGNLNGV